VSLPQVTVSRRSVLLGAGAAGVAVAAPAAASAAAPFAHPGMLHTAADFARIRTGLAAGDAVVTAGWQRLTGNGRSHSTWQPRPLATVIRGGTGQNYPQFYLDVHAAYQNALRWRITGEKAHGDAARDILNAWSRTLTAVAGNADRFLAAGIYGYQFANAAELMRGYDGFDLAAAQSLLMTVFHPMNEDFLVRHNTACITNYWANWDLCTVASILAIGILCDDRTLVDRAVGYCRTGAGNGSIPHAIPFLHGGLGQWQESGRDQAHTVMGVGLLGTICEMAWNQGIDLYGFDDNRFLKGAEYVARYNRGLDVPFSTYRWGTGQKCAPREQTVISAASRGQARPVWEVVLNHYEQRRGLSAPNVAAIAAGLRAEGGGGDYGPNSGGFDALGFGTLLFTRDRVAATRTPSSAPARHTAASPSSAGRPARAPSHGSRSARSAAAPEPAPTTSATSPGSPDLRPAGQSSSGTGVAGVTAGAAAAAIGGALLLRLRRRGRHAQ
jgi:hypothetical protein